MTMKIKQQFDPYAHGINNMNVLSYDTGEAFANAVLLRYEVNGYVEHSAYSPDFAGLLQELIDGGMVPKDHLQVISAVNNLIYFRITAELEEESRNEIVESAKAWWKDERKKLRDHEKEKQQAETEKQLKALADLGIERSTLRGIVDGKLDIPSKQVGSGIQPGRQVMQKR